MNHGWKRSAAALAIAALLAVALGTIACSSGDDDEILACFYERRSTSCSSSSFGPWEEGCITFNSGTLRDDITPAQACNDATDDTIECTATCCISFQYRNVQMVNGACP